MRRNLIAGLIVATLGLAACRGLGDPPVAPIPVGFDVFEIEPSLLFYDFVDSTLVPSIRLQWIPQGPYVGTNCFALSPRTGADTTGTFVFVYRGRNVGSLMRTTNNNISDVDTVGGAFLSGVEGTGGSYAVTSSGGLNLTWNDGVLARFFDPAATIRMVGDTIFSDVHLTSRGDSVTVDWSVRWSRSLDC